MAAAAAPLILFTTIAMLGLPESATYWVAKNSHQARPVLKKASWILAAAGVLASLVAVALAPVIASGDASLVLLISITAVAIVPSVILGALRGTAAGLHLWDLVNAERYVGAGFRLVSIILLALFDALTPATAVASVASAPLVAGLVYLKLQKYLANESIMGSGVQTRQLFGYGMRVWVGASSGILLSRIDQVLLAPLSNTFQLGLYAAAVTVSEAALLANNAVRDVTLAADATESADERISLSARISFAVSIAVGLILALTLPIWFTVVFGNGFVDAIPVTVMLVVAAVLGVPGSVGGAGLSARGRPGLRSLGLVIAAVVNVALLVAWVPLWGAMGAAGATLIGNVVASNMNLIFLKTHYKMRLSDFYLIRISDIQTLGRVTVRVLRKASQRGKS
ncbi:UNVERIFIED_ORG: O-antigen/teichoic acid export membrane protein [Arthrobacter sp. UYEF10]